MALVLPDLPKELKISLSNDATASSGSGGNSFSTGAKSGITMMAGNASNLLPWILGGGFLVGVYFMLKKRA